MDSNNKKRKKETFLKKTRRKCLGRKSKKRKLDCDGELKVLDNSTGSTRSFNLQYSCKGEKKSGKLRNKPVRKKARKNTDKDETIEYSDGEIELEIPNDNDVFEPTYNLPYVDKCLYDLRNGDFLEELLNILDQNRCLQDFMTLLELLKSGNLSPLNIAFLLCIERAKWESNKNTCGMRYRIITRQFWEVVYKVCGGTTVNLFRGRKNRTDVINQEATKGYYDPRRADINFAVPDNKVLQKGKFTTNAHVKPSIFEDVLKNLDKGKEYILSFDGKRVARGLGKGTIGEVDLWSYEVPSLTERNLKLHNELLQVAKLNAADATGNRVELGKNLRNILLINSNNIKDVRHIVHKQERKLEKLLNPAPSSKVRNVDFAISHYKTMIFARQEFITATLKLNKSICELLAKLQITNHFFSYAPALTLCCQHNCRCLHEPGYVKQHVDLNDLPHLCKQRTDEWLDFRKKAHVTGSSCHNALGLRSVKALTEHFRHYVFKQKQQFPPDVQTRLDHGSKNEVNATATTVGILMPALTTPCSILYEEGVNFLNGNVKKPLLADSPDGLIRTLLGDHSCTNRLDYGHSRIVLEIKCPYGNKWKVQQHYEVHYDYIIQCILHMKVKNANKCWYVVWTDESTTLSELTFHQRTWDVLWSCIREWYDVSTPSKPQNIKQMQNKLKPCLNEYRRNHCKFICEIPSIKGQEGNLEFTSPFYPYSIPIDAMPYSCTKDELEECVNKITEMNITCVEEAHQLMRSQASEILAFVLTDTDRKKEPENTTITPIAYCMKDSTLNIPTMRKILHDVRDKCKEYGLNILCQTFDGQFSKIATLDEDGNPLTLYQLQKQYWRRTLATTSKIDMCQFLEEFAHVTPATLRSLLSWQIPNDSGTYTTGNLDFMWNANGYRFALGSVGNELGTMTDITTPGKESYPTLWRQIEKRKGKPTRSKIVPTDLDTSEVDRLIPSSLSQQVDTQNDDSLEWPSEVSSSEDEDSDYEPSLSDDDEEYEYDSDDSGAGATFIDESLNDTLLAGRDSTNRDEETLFLDQVMNALQSTKNAAKWKHMPLKTMYTNVFSSADKIAKLFVYELDAIGKIIFQFTGKIPFQSKANKEDKVNAIARVFGDKSVMTSTRKKTTQPEDEIPTLDPKSLKEISRSFILSVHYPKELICASYAKLNFDEEIQQWKQRSTVPCKIKVRNTNITHEMYSFPSYCHHRNQLEPSCIDPTHILGNLRVHFTTKNINGCDHNAFKRVYQVNNKALPRAIITDVLDKQSTQISKKVFSEQVADIMFENDDALESEMVLNIHRWFKACDEREIGTPMRLVYLQQMFDYMLEQVSFHAFPPQTTHMKGIPIVTFEAILQGIDTRFQLYALSSQKTYNHRAISTLAIETFFGHLSRLEYTSTGNPKSTQIHVLMAHILKLQEHQNDPERGFHMITTLRPFYPDFNTPAANISLSESSSNDGDSDDDNDDDAVRVTAHPHGFDTKATFQRKKRKKWSKIAQPTEVTRGSRGVRQYHHIDESKLLPEKRLGKSLSAIPTRLGYKIVPE